MSVDRKTISLQEAVGWEVRNKHTVLSVLDKVNQKLWKNDTKVCFDDVPRLHTVFGGMVSESKIAMYSEFKKNAELTKVESRDTILYGYTSDCFQYGIDNVGAIQNYVRCLVRGDSAVVNVMHKSVMGRRLSALIGEDKLKDMLQNDYQTFLDTYLSRDLDKVFEEEYRKFVSRKVAIEVGSSRLIQVPKDFLPVIHLDKVNQTAVGVRVTPYGDYTAYDSSKVLSSVEKAFMGCLAGIYEPLHLEKVMLPLEPMRKDCENCFTNTDKSIKV